MKFTPQQYAQALFDSISETNPKDHDKIMDRFVKILAQNGDLNKHAEIEAEFRRLDMKAKGISEVEVTFAKEHNTAILDELNEMVKGKAEYKTKIDQNIVGGLVVKVDDTLIDASVKTQLEHLNKELKE